MAQCNVNDLMAEAACYYDLDPFRLQVLTVALWCQISGGSPPSNTPSWWNPDLPGGGAPIVDPDLPGTPPIINPDT